MSRAGIQALLLFCALMLPGLAWALDMSDKPELTELKGHFGELLEESDSDNKWFALDKEARESFRREDFSSAEKTFKEAISYAESISKFEPGAVNSLLGLSMLNEKLSKPQESERLYELAMRYEEGTYSSESEHFAKFLPDLAWLYHWHGKDGDSERTFMRALKILEKLKGEDHIMLIDILSQYRDFLKSTGRAAEAEKVERRLDRIRAK